MRRFRTRLPRRHERRIGLLNQQRVSPVDALVEIAVELGWEIAEENVLLIVLVD